MRAVGVQLEICELGLRCNNIDGRQQPLLLLSAIAFVLLAGDADGLELHLQIVVGVYQLPVSLFGLLHYRHYTLPELFGRERAVFARHVNRVAIAVIAQAAPQRLDILKIE